MNTEEVKFWIPTGTETWKLRKLIGKDTDGTDGWSLNWQYNSSNYHHHIIIEAIGTNGSTQYIFNVYKQDTSESIGLINKW